MQKKPNLIFGLFGKVMTILLHLSGGFGGLSTFLHTYLDFYSIETKKWDIKKCFLALHYGILKINVGTHF